jgi:hypothetical protein
MTPTHRVACVASCTALLAGIAACGGAEIAPKSAPAASPAKVSKDQPAEPTTIEEAQDQIARARASLESPSASARDEAKKTERSEPQKGASPSSSRSPQGGGASSSREEKPSTEADTCGNPCRALASMKRAVESLCRMTGDGDNRCVDAKRTLSESTTRVASCKCG